MRISPAPRPGLGLFLATAISLLQWMALGAATPGDRKNSWSLTSPNGQCRIAVALGDDGALCYQVWRGERLVIAKSPLGLQRDDQDFSRGLAFHDAGKVKNRRERYGLLAGGAARVDHRLNGRTLTFGSANNATLEIELAASDEGVAFRYRFPERSPEVRVLKAELTGFQLPLNARGWLQPYHGAGPYTPAYEDFFFSISPGDPPPHSRDKPVGWCFPALFQVPDAMTWVLLTESGTDGSYCGCHLQPGSSGGLYRVGFPLADEGTKGHTDKFGPEPQSVLPWATPWRVIVLGKSAGEIAMATLVTDLAPASRIVDTSWIKPGRASWAWWAYPDGPATAELFNEFTDFADRMDWEYTLFDAGWWGPGLSNIAAHAKARGVKPLAWSHAEDFYDADKRRRKLDEMVAAGVSGVKVDFWCSDRQEAIAAMQALFADAAARKLVVNLHGCTIPRGWERTWPNFLTSEAVLGTESYFYEPGYTDKAAELNTVLPFTRNAVGPMDSTPVACSPKKFARTTTAAHELATAINLRSGLIHYADQPEFFASLPKEAVQLLRDAPARWDETRCLVGEPGRVVVFARRAGKSWFIAGLNGTGESLPVNLDLSAFGRFAKRLALTEGTDAAMQVVVAPFPSAAQWQHSLPPRGGFILRLDK
jgi:alpha-glucosidase